MAKHSAASLLAASAAAASLVAPFVADAFAPRRVRRFAPPPPPRLVPSLVRGDESRRPRPLSDSAADAGADNGDGDGDDASKTTKAAASGPRAESSSSSFPRRRSPAPLRARRSPQRRRPPRRAQAAATKRAPHQYDHTQDIARPFVDAPTEIENQSSNEDAEPYDLDGSDELRAAAAAGEGRAELAMAAANDLGPLISHAHFEHRSLDSLFPSLGFSDLFSSSKEFRDELRNAMREDIFDTTPAYASMSDKARRMLLLPDSSLQGSWKCRGGRWLGSSDDRDGDKDGDGDEPRMTKLTRVLRGRLGPSAPTGDDFMDSVGSLCGSSPTTHWIDIIGIGDRRISHSWHQDTGRCSPDGDTYTVMLGFPAEDGYDGVGVFSHVVKLQRERWAPEDHPPNEPVVYGGMVEEEYVVRPRFAKGKEILMYRDIDVVHSAPDVAYRTSVMRFM